MKLKGLTRKNDRVDLPVVPLKDMVIFPRMVAPFFVGRAGSIKAVEQAMSSGRTLFLAGQKTAADTPTEDDMNVYGTMGTILQMLKLPDGNIRVLVEGKERGEAKRYRKSGELVTAQVEPIPEATELNESLSVLMETVRSTFGRLKKHYKKLSKESIAAIESAEYPDRLVDLICGHLPLKTERKLELLSMVDPGERLEALAVILEQEYEVQSLQQKIQSKVRSRIEKSQKEYFLNEQLKEIKKELGTEEEAEDELDALGRRILSKNPPQEVADRATRELKRLKKLQPMSPESGVIRTYLEWLGDLPWSERSEDSYDITAAERVLDEDHYDMKKPKERILDFIAVRQLTDVIRGPILCLVGPPGTGKTSLGRSVARALGREFVRMSLGGVRDEAEIRGHRKTYVGALPGKIIQSMKKVGTVNPVFLLDEIDKLSSDYRGDPASALLEVLDPEQNNTFMDHYLEVPYDLSSVFFITTANSMHTIPYALRDRMEIIELPGYTEFEKVRIATDFLIPKQLRQNGLEGAHITFNRPAIRTIIQNYTMESGVRNLEREIATVVRKVARDALKHGYRPAPASTQPTADEEHDHDHASSGTVEADAQKLDTGTGLPPDAPEIAGDGAAVTSAETETSEAATAREDREEPQQQGADESTRIENYKTTVTPKRVEQFLGQRKFLDDLVYRDARPGLVHGVAWTETGGTLLPIEVVVIDGGGDLILTGSLGEVMKESARTGLSFMRSHCNRFNLPPDFYRDRDIHIHVPEGAIPKDGPSAGITITAALVSAFTGVSVEPGIAMTGEITLTGRLLAIGGLKEKVLAAHRNKMRAVLIPEQNRKDVVDLPREVRSSLTIHFADSALEALLILFPGSFER